MSKLILLSIIAFAFLSCDLNNNSEEVLVEENKEFSFFLEKFKEIDTPFQYHSSRINNFNFKSNKLDLNTSDSLYIKANKDDEIYCYGKFKKDEFYALIFFFTASDYYPVLATYSSKGKLISQSPLMVNGCGGDCGMSYCSSSATISTDLKIVCTDSINYEFRCDNQGEPIKNSEEEYADIIHGFISENGNIKLGKTKRINSINRNLSAEK